MLSALKIDILSALKMTRFQPDCTIFFTHFFSPTGKTLQNPNLATIFNVLSNSRDHIWHFMTEKSASA
jgi:hypothetical protein